MRPLDRTRLPRRAGLVAACAALAAPFAATAQLLPPDHPPPAGHERYAPSLEFAPMMLDISPDEALGFPRSYGERPCPESVVRRIFRAELTDEFLASLRCWAVPGTRSGEFVRALDQAIPGAGWTYASAAGMAAHYRKEGKELDVLIFGFDQFGDPDERSTDVGYLFGVVETDGD